MFIRIPEDYLKKIYVQNERIPSLYFHKNKIARDFFWKRLEIAHFLIEKNAKFKERCLDFGCGNGVFLPSLASIFSQVLGIDMETRETAKIIDHYNLDNIKVINADLNTFPLGDKEFDVVIAMDVLEHFKELEKPVSQIKKCLRDNGLLVTSLPTENFFTWLTRKVSNTEKPFDHYHKGITVENFIENSGFRKIERIILSSCFPLYYISLWEKSR